MNKDQLNAIVGNETEKLFFKSFDTTVSTLSKTFIFVMLPFMAGFLFLFFFRQFKYYGAALVLATHSMVFNLCFFTVHCLVDWLPYRVWGHGHFFSRPAIWLADEKFATYFGFISMGSFELFHLFFWVPWLYIAFKRLFNKPWWFNLLVAFICSRIFYYLVFGVLKKLLIAFTVWTLH